MATLDIDLRVRGASRSGKDINDTAAAVSNMEKQLQEAKKEMGAFYKESMSLQRALRYIKSAFDAGTMSEEAFNRESRRISSRLTEIAGNIQKAQGRVKSYEASLAQAGNATRSFGNVTRQLQAYSDDFTGGIRSANTVSVEFSRIIQDLPYGMQGIGNNIQQLSQNWAYYVRNAREAAAASGQVVTTKQLLAGAVRNLFSPLNAITLGISLVTAGWIAYEKWAQKSAKATREASKDTRDYAENLGLVDRAMHKAAQSYGTEIARMNTLMAVTRDTNVSVRDRASALKELQGMYPAVFKNFDLETIKTETASEAYKELTRSIIASARARAAEGMVGERSASQLALVMENSELTKQIALTKEQIQLNKQRAEEIRSSITARTTAQEAEAMTRTADALDRALGLNSELDSLYEKRAKNAQDIAELQEGINTLTEFAVENQSKVNTALLDTSKGLKDASKKADDLYKTLAKQGDYFEQQAAKILLDYNKLVKGILQSGGNKADINKALGIAEANKNTDLLVNSFEKLFFTVDKMAKAAKTLRDENRTLTAPDLRTLPPGTIPQITQEERDWFYLTRGGQNRSRLTANLGGSGDKDLEKRLGKVVERGLRRGIDDIFNDIDNLGSNFYEVFANVFQKLASTVTSTFGQVLSTELGNLLAGRINAKDFSIAGLSNSQSKALVAGGGLLGGILMGQGAKRANMGLSIGGGLLSGAAAGMAFGPWGAAIGAVIGGIAGIFSGSQAKKQQELEKAQLEEQKKQTALLERQNALAFTSSIIGTQTNQGIVTGVDRNAFGEIEFTIEGRKLKAVLDRENAALARGL